MSALHARLHAQADETPLAPINAPFDYQPLTRVVYGRGAIHRIGSIARELDGRRALIVTDSHIVAAGHVDHAITSIRCAGLEAVVFDRVQENPTSRLVNECAAFAREQSVDLLVGIGGGSSLDTAKGCNFIYTNGGCIANYWGVGKATKPMLPTIAVPTTAGTGSEAQSFALIADDATHQKMACGDKKAACRAAILDPVVTVTQPPAVTVATGLDAIAHALESYVTTRRNPLSQMFAREAWRMLELNFELVLAEPDNLDARGAMLLGANLAGTAIENSMLGATHACANPLTSQFQITHGVAIALMLPHVIRFNSPAVERLYADLSTVAGLEPTGGAGEAIARRVEQLRAAGGQPCRLSECGVKGTDVTQLASEAARQWTGTFNPRPLSVANFEELYRCAL